MENRPRLPGELLWPLGWCAFLGCIALFVAASSEVLLLRIIYGLLGMVYLVISYSLYRLHNWARIAAGMLFGLGIALAAFAMSRKGFSAGHAVRLVMNLWWGVYMFLPSTKKLFVEGERVRLDPAGCLTQLTMVSVMVSLAIALVLVESPKWVMIGALVVSVPLFSHLAEPRLDRAFRALFSRCPPDLDPAAWKTFRLAQHHRAAKKPQETLELIEILPDVPSVRALRALARGDSLGTLGALERVVLDADYYPSDEDQERLKRDAAVPAEVDRVLEERTQAIEALLEDDAQERLYFGEEAEHALDRLTGLFFFQNAMFQHRRDWENRRPLLAGAWARVWFVIRLWERGATAAAEAVAQGCPDADIRELARICRMSDDIGSDRISDDWVDEHTDALILLPFMTEPMRLLLLDLPYIGTFGASAVASRMRRRIELVAKVRKLQREYPEETERITALLLCVLSGHPKGVVEKKKAFDAWWSVQAEYQVRFDSAFTAGLEAAVADDWEKAVKSFREAQEAWPERVSATYNGALALHKLDRHSEAEALFEKLTKAEPEEALFRMRLGDMRRYQSKRKQALQDYRKVAQLGELDEEVAVRLGVLLAQEGREDEAVEALKPALGDDVSAETLDGLADFLEAQGVFQLAHRYRQEALERELQRAKETTEDEESEEEEGDTGTLDPSDTEDIPEDFVRGMKALKMRLFHDACTEFERVVESEPDNGLAWHFLGMARLGSSRKAEARDAFTRSAEATESPHLGKVECPECGWIPSGESFWVCDQCGESFDTFKTRATCPACSHTWGTTVCMACRQTPAHHAWWLGEEKV